MKLTTLLLIFITQNLISQYSVPDNGSGNISFEHNWQENYSKHEPRDGDIKIDKDGKMWRYNEPLPEHNPNLFRDDCGNWLERKTTYTSWQSRKPQQVSKEHSFQIIPITEDPCFPPNPYEQMEYRLDLENKTEWYRKVKVTYEKVKI